MWTISVFSSDHSVLFFSISYVSLYVFLVPSLPQNSKVRGSGMFCQKLRQSVRRYGRKWGATGKRKVSVILSLRILAVLNFRNIIQGGDQEYPLSSPFVPWSYPRVKGWSNFILPFKARKSLRGKTLICSFLWQFIHCHALYTVMKTGSHLTLHISGIYVILSSSFRP